MSGRLGIVMLVHKALPRAAEVARHWASAGCPVVIHLDRALPAATCTAFRQELSDLPHVSFSPRFRCEWGTWGIVAASQTASGQLLHAYPDVQHVYLTSGSCLPLRPVEELKAFLDARPDTDFIESATVDDVPWIVDGLGRERFTLRFPFAWRRRRALFDAWVEVQRRLHLARRVPDGLVPHLGSQWWCLTRRTLSAILNDPRRPGYDRFFRWVWIPDESYFQTLARQHARRIESRSLTLSKFDHQGRPHIFYDDHMDLLQRSNCFVARKIWPHADKLYTRFLSADAAGPARVGSNANASESVFSGARDRRTRGRPGLYMQSRFPVADRENGITAARYSVFHGFTELFEGFEAWLEKATDANVHGHLFDRDKVEFSDDAAVVAGALTDSVSLRDHNPQAFLTNLIWNLRDKRQCFQFGPRSNQAINWRVAKDTNAQVSVITGAWVIPLFRSKGPFDALRQEAAWLQQIEADHLHVLRSGWARARIRIWTLAEFVAAPMAPLQEILDEMEPGRPRHPTEAPRMVDLTGLAQFLQALRDAGMHPYLAGQMPSEPDLGRSQDTSRPRPYLVR